MSGFYIGIDGKARKVKGGYIGIDGVARKIKKGYIGVDGVARLCWAAFDGDPVFANNTWEDIAAACQAGVVPDTWSVGDQKTMTIDGVDYAIDIIGKNHDNYSDGSGKAPLTFQIHPVYKLLTMNAGDTNVGGWERSKMRTEHIPSIFEKMPESVRTSIRKVNKLTSAGGKSELITTTADDLFLLSEIEVFGVANFSLDGEGTQYEYHKTKANRAKTLQGTGYSWWLRSPYKFDNAHFARVDTTGNGNAAVGSGSNGVAFAFCF